MPHSNGKSHTQERLRRALLAGRIAAWERDLETDRLSWSDNVLEVLGGTYADGAEFEGRVHPDDRARHREALRRTFSEGVTYDLELRFIRPDGCVIWIHDKAELQADGSGRRTLSGITIDITARKRAEAEARSAGEALRRSEERWRGLFERMHEGFFIGEAIRDSRGHMHDFLFVEVNPAFGALTGLHAQEVVGRAVREAIPGIQEDLIATYERVVSTGRPAHFEVHVPALGGRWYEARARVVGPERFAVLFLEVTARKLAEARVQEKAGLLETTLETIDQGIIMVDAEETIRAYNRRVLDLLDLPEHVMRGPRSYEAVKRYQRQRGEFVRSSPEQRQWLDTGDFLHKAARYERERPNGTVLEVRSVPLAGGGAVRTFTDITARKAADAEVRKSEARFRTLTEAMPALVFACDREGRNEYTNSQYQTYTGLSADDLLGDRWMEVVHPDDRQRIAEGWEQARRLGHPSVVEYRLRCADGSYRWFLGRAVPLRDGAGAVERWLGTCIDIHDRRVAQDALTKSEEHLRLATEATGLGTFDVNLETGEDWWSDELRNVLGVSKDVVAGQASFRACIHPEDRGWMIEAHERALLRQEASFNEDFRIVRPDDGQTR